MQCRKCFLFPYILWALSPDPPGRHEHHYKKGSGLDSHTGVEYFLTVIQTWLLVCNCLSVCELIMIFYFLFFLVLLPNGDLDDVVTPWVCWATPYCGGGCSYQTGKLYYVLMCKISCFYFMRMFSWMVVLCHKKMLRVIGRAVGRTTVLQSGQVVIVMIKCVKADWRGWSPHVWSLVFCRPAHPGALVGMNPLQPPENTCALGRHKAKAQVTTRWQSKKKK